MGMITLKGTIMRVMFILKGTSQLLRQAFVKELHAMGFLGLDSCTIDQFLFLDQNGLLTHARDFDIESVHTAFSIPDEWTKAITCISKHFTPSSCPIPTLGRITINHRYQLTYDHTSFTERDIVALEDLLASRAFDAEEVQVSFAEKQFATTREVLSFDTVKAIIDWYRGETT